MATAARPPEVVGDDRLTQPVEVHGGRDVAAFNLAVETAHTKKMGNRPRFRMEIDDVVGHGVLRLQSYTK